MRPFSGMRLTIQALQIMSLVPATSTLSKGLFPQPWTSPTRALSNSQQQRPSPVVICGPSGVGKGTLISALLNEFGDHIAFAVSHTTRSPRKGENEGRDYYFTTLGDMRDSIAAEEFIEHVEVHGNLYGTSVASVKKVVSKGKVCVLDIDTQGVRAIKTRAARGDLGFAPLYVFIAPPSIEELRRRLTARGTETPEQIESRMQTAEAEVAWALSGDGDSTKEPTWDAVLVNDDMTSTSTTLRELVLHWHPHLCGPHTETH